MRKISAVLIFLFAWIGVKAQSPVIITQPYKFQKYVHVAGSLFADSTLLNTDSTNRAATTAWVKRNGGASGSFIKNTTSLQNSANFNIDGTGSARGGLRIGDSTSGTNRFLSVYRLINGANVNANFGHTIKFGGGAAISTVDNINDPHALVIPNQRAYPLFTSDGGVTYHNIPVIDTYVGATLDTATHTLTVTGGSDTNLGNSDLTQSDPTRTFTVGTGTLNFIAKNGSDSTVMSLESGEFDNFTTNGTTTGEMGGGATETLMQSVEISTQNNAQVVTNTVSGAVTSAEIQAIDGATGKSKTISVDVGVGASSGINLDDEIDNVGANAPRVYPLTGSPTQYAQYGKVDSLIAAGGGGGVSFNNGLNQDGADVRLGGTLNQNTDIDIAGNILKLGDDATNTALIIAPSGNISMSGLSDTTAVDTGLVIHNGKLYRQIVSGGTTTNPLTLGYGLLGTSFNGSTAVTAKSDSSVLQTVLNFFPKGDTRYAKISALPIGANPTASAGTTAVNGSATTFMRSDAAPKVDTSALQTVLNFFPKGDTRYYKSSNPSGYISSNQSISFAPTGEVTGSTTGTTTLAPALTVSNSAVIGKVLTGYTSGAGTVASTDNILQAIQKINGNDALKAPLISPSFTTPSLGTATATSINGNIWTTGTGTFTQAAGSTLQTTGAFTLNLTTTANSTPTFPTGSGTLLYSTGSGSSLTGIPTSVSNSDGTLTISPTTGAVVASLALGHANTWTGRQIWNNSVTASSALAIGDQFTPTLVAAANSDDLIGLDISPAYTPGSFTPVYKHGLRVDGEVYIGAVNLVHSNIIIGDKTAGKALTGAASSNLFFGSGVAPSITTGINNAFFGTSVGAALGTTSQGNTVFGNGAFQGASGAVGNVSVLGYNAGGGSGNIQNGISIGASSNFSTASTNEIIIGYNTTGKGSNTTAIGNTSTTNTYLYGAVGEKHTLSAVNSTATLTATQMATGYITSTSAAATTLTTPTATALATQMGAAGQGFTYDFTIDNTAGANVVTLALGSGFTLLNDPTNISLTTPSGVTGISTYRVTFVSTTAATISRLPLNTSTQAAADLTVQTAAGNVTTFTVGASTATFNISTYINVTAVSVDVIQGQITYTDENSTSQTVSLANISAIGNSTYSPITIRAKNGTVITVKTNLTTGAGTITFDTGARITQL